jgi:hypothetical protein
MRRLILLILFFAAFADTSLGQRCPRSTRTISVIVVNGTRAENVQYEMFQIMPPVVTDRDKFTQWLSEKFAIIGDQARFVRVDQSTEVTPYYAERFLGSYKASDYAPVLEALDIKLKGRIKLGTLTFNATDTAYNLYLLKVWSDNFEPAYLVGDLTGGCHDHDRIFLGTPKKKGRPS